MDTIELKRELRLLRDAGIGGVEINPIEFPSKRCDSLGIPSLTWLSNEWLDALDVTLREAKRLGMQCDLLVGSGWPFGSETLPMEHRAQVMLVYSTPVDLTEGEFTITKQQIFDAVDPKVTEPNADRQFELVDLFIVPDTVKDIEQRYAVHVDKSNDSQQITLSSYQHINTSKGWLYALVRCTSFASVINGAPGASGPILDHMNREAVLSYLNHMSSTLEHRFGPMKNWLRAYFVDSMELEGSNWTDDFAEEFRRRNGYDIMPWLPFVLFPTGRLGEVTSYDYGAYKSPEMEKKIQMARLHFECTKAQLLYERFTTVFADWCREQGVKSRGQAYGRGFFPLQSSSAYDIPEGESWTTNYLRHRIGEEMPDSDYRRGRAYTMINKLVSSAAHQNGHRLVSAEEMTNTYRLFETTLELLKLGSDMSAFSGITHSVWHGFNYSPPQAGFPGWVQYGSYLNEQNTWWPYFHLLNEYRSRMSAILQNADMQTDIAILLPIDSLWAQYGVQTEPFPNYPKGSPYDIPHLLWEAVHKNGGNCDFITPRQLDTATVHDGKLIIGKKAYKALLITPPTTFDPSLSVLNSQLPVIEAPNLPDRNYIGWYHTAQQMYNLPHSVTITEPKRYLLQNHYRNDQGDDIFLFVNAQLYGAVSSSISFPKEIYHGRTAWVYNPATDKRQLLQLDNGDFWLYLPPAETLFILFEKSNPAAIAAATKWTPSYTEGLHYIHIPMRWHVSLHHALEGWTRDTIMQELCDLRQTQFKDFSGTVIYTAHFHLDSITVDTLQDVTYTPESLESIDLGLVYDICELSVNGSPCGDVATEWEQRYNNGDVATEWEQRYNNGDVATEWEQRYNNITRWYGKRIYDNIGGLLHPGDNTIEIRITTTLNNYVHTLTDDKVIQHYIFKRNVPTTPAGLVGIEGHIAFF